MDLLEIIRAKRIHVDRLANERGAVGEVEALDKVEAWIPRPKGKALALLIRALADAGINIRGSSFDAIATSAMIDWQSLDSIRRAIPEMVFIEIKTSNQTRVKAGFEGFFFALTESEISAADQLGPRHRVALFNRLTGDMLFTNIPEILARTKSMTWQLSVQL